MTDVSKLASLAQAIAAGSTKIKAYAKAQAAATKSQETDIQSRAKQSDLAALATRVSALESPPPSLTVYPSKTLYPSEVYP